MDKITDQPANHTPKEGDVLSYIFFAPNGHLPLQINYISYCQRSVEWHKWAVTTPSTQKFQEMHDEVTDHVMNNKKKQ